MDQIANMAIALKNASLAQHEIVVVPYSKLKHAIADALLKAHFVKAVSKKTKKNLPVLEIELAYNNENPKIRGVERVSKSSRRVYAGAHSLKRALGAKGATFISTPKGILTDVEARKENVGGEVLLKIW